jgi:hypothetical protein
MFPKVSLEILFINLYNLSRMRDVESMLESLPATAGRQPVETLAEDHLATATQEKSEVSFDFIAPDPRPAPTLAVNAPAEAARPTGNFESYLKERNTMLFGFLGAFQMTVRDDAVVIALDKRSEHVRTNASIVGELKKHAADYFKKDMNIRFVDGPPERTDTIDDYVKEAELLFSV